MSKPCYEEYVNHAVRFYVRNPALCMSAPGLKKSDIQNWMTCNEIINRYADKERDIITEVYRFRGSLSDAVSAVAGLHRIEDGTVWQIMNRFAKDFAKKRGLI